MTSLHRRLFMCVFAFPSAIYQPESEAAVAANRCQQIFLTHSALLPQRLAQGKVVFVAPITSAPSSDQLRLLDARLQDPSRTQQTAESIVTAIRYRFATSHRLFSAFDAETTEMPLNDFFDAANTSQQPTILVTALDGFNDRLATEYSTPIEIAKLMNLLSLTAHGDTRYISPQHASTFASYVLAQNRTAFLATGTQNHFAPHEVARALARENKLYSRGEWENWIRLNRPRGLPMQAAEAYRGNGWTSWTEFFGPKFMPYAEASAWARALGIKTRGEWETRTTGSQRPDDVPANPHQTYKHSGWVSWQTFLGTEFVSYEEASQWAQANAVRSSADWKKRTKGSLRPENIPAAPHVAYPEWKSWPSFLGSEFVSYQEASAWARAQGIRTQLEWSERTKGHQRPLNIPSTPGKAYQDTGWTNWKNFLGTGKP